MTRDRVIGALVALALLAGGWWYYTNTEWVTQSRWRPAKGEARDNPVYAFEQLLRHLGLQAEHHDRLDRLPPEGGRLILLSNEWALMPERAAELRAWVQRGGHLILTRPADWDDTPLEKWVPIIAVDVKKRPVPPAAASAASAGPSAAAAKAGAAAQDESTSDGLPTTSSSAKCEASGAASHSTAKDDAVQSPGGKPPNAPAQPGGAHTEADDGCSNDTAASDAASEDDQGAAEGDDDEGDGEADDEDDDLVRARATPPLFGSVDPVRTCSLFYESQRLVLTPGSTAQWTISTGAGSQGLRVAMGQGSVTVLNVNSQAFMNGSAQQCEHPLLLTSAIQAAPGATVWLYLNEKREALLPWLWHQGWIAIVMGLLALTAALWRHAVRFGPRVAPLPRLRRSISEQVRGLGAYLHREGADALLAAQQRALDDTAARHLPGYRRQTVPERVRLVAEATLLDRHDLASAMTARFCTRAELPPRLHLLETARRRLQDIHDERHST
ncbi:DUF4350 domain-containing protein [Roseateles amylovorans]|uniref:DUF4350 domain-containing protein n=1 Tax=Roseateles amylovorans TaxID=2978473 RepID=A0ABY6B390_9BURK|nr:DUF4350 domain-containing protein [Roseateles amylovorans]UXH79645.1 DUF4350 domain-containing protein [Roseateles amylovorans]